MKDDVAPGPEASVSLARRMADLRPRLIGSLRDHQPLIVLASLMLILASFIRAISEEAAAFAATSAVVFVIALSASLMEDLTEDGNIYFLSLTFLGVAVGFALLIFVAYTLVKSLAVGFLLFTIVTQGAIIATLAALTFGQVVLYIDSFRSPRIPQRIRRTTLFLTIMGILGLAMVIGVTPVMFSFGTTEQPTAVQAVLLAGVTLAVISAVGNAEIKDRYMPKTRVETTSPSG